MKTIIVPTDFSKGAENALHHALALAKTSGAKVTVVHAYSAPPSGSAVMVDISEVMEKNAKEELEMLQKKVADTAVQHDEISLNYEARHGSVVDVINQFCKKGDAELVVMGTQGTNGVAERLMGSNTAAAAKKINIPLLAIPGNSKPAAFKNMLFATDMKTSESQTAYRFLKEFIGQSRPKIEFIHIDKGDKKSGATSSQVEFESAMNTYFDGIETRYSSVSDDSIDRGIKKAVETSRPDLVIVVRRSYGFFEGLFHNSVSADIINAASVPVLVLKD